MIMKPLGMGMFAGLVAQASRTVTVLVMAIACLATSSATDLPKELVNHRPLTWDGGGLVPLDAFHPLNDLGKMCIECVKKFDYGRIQTLCEKRLSKQDDFVAAWFLAQTAIIRNTELTTIEKLKAWRVSRPYSHALLLASYTLADHYSWSQMWRRMKYEDRQPFDRDVLSPALDEVRRLSATCEPELCIMCISHAEPDIEVQREMMDKLAAKYPDCLGVLMEQASVYASQLGGYPADGKGGLEILVSWDLKKAEDIVNKVLKAHKDYAPAYYDLGQIKLREKKRSEGIALLEKFIAMPGANSRLIKHAKCSMEGRPYQGNAD